MNSNAIAASVSKAAEDYYSRFISSATTEQVARFRDAMESASCGSEGVYHELAHIAGWELDIRAAGY